MPYNQYRFFVLFVHRLLTYSIWYISLISWKNLSKASLLLSLASSATSRMM